MTSDDERIALFLDYENLAIGARDHLGGALRLAARSPTRSPNGAGSSCAGPTPTGRTSTRTGACSTRHHVELIEMPQRMGAVRKNAADIKMAVDAIELCFERDYITTFVIGTGDSDFTPLVHKLRELNKRVIGIGVERLDVGAAAAGVRRVPLLRAARRRRGGRRRRRAATRQRERPQPSPRTVAPSPSRRTWPAAPETDLGCARHADARGSSTQQRRSGAGVVR